jgi:hypothetical protein
MKVAGFKCKFEYLRMINDDLKFRKKNSNNYKKLKKKRNKLFWCLIKNKDFIEN